MRVSVMAAASIDLCCQRVFLWKSACSILSRVKPLLLATSSASVPKELIATEKSMGSDTLLFCAPETLFFLCGELRLNDQIF